MTARPAQSRKGRARKARKKTCPFCGWGRIKVHADTERDRHFAVCLLCGARGPWRRVKANAARIWNERATEEAPDARRR